MSRSTSVFLDAARFTAALVVFAGHLSGARFTAGLGWQLGRYMDDCVAVFFVLSGYVVSYATHQRETDLRSYTISRASRVVSVTAPALILSFLLDGIGRWFSPWLYNASWGYSGAHPWLQAVLAASFTAQCWWLDVAPGSDLPWWSLCYEVFYYVAFAAILFGGRRAMPVLLLCLAIMGPPIALMFPLWLAGALLYRVRAGDRLPVPLAFPALALSVCVWAGFLAFADRLPDTTYLGLTKHLDPLRAYVVGGSFALTVVSIELAGRLPAVDRLGAAVERPARLLASLTFTIYLLHLPVAQAIVAIGGISPVSTWGRVVVLGGTALAMLPLAWLGEHRKQLWQRWFRRAACPLT